MGVGSNTYNVKPGKYSLSARKKGYKTRSETISIEGGQQLTYEFDLQVEKPVRKPRESAAAQGRDLELAGRFQEALAQYEKALVSRPQDLSSILGKARCLKKIGRVDMAVTSYMQAASVAGNVGDIDSQIEALSGVIGVRPKTLTAYSSRGDLYFEQGKYGQAAADYEQVIQLDQRNLGTYYKLGRSYYNAGQYHDALVAFQAAEDLNFADPRAQVYLAETYLALNDTKSMKKSFEKFEEMAGYSIRLQFKNDPEWQRVLEAVGAEH